MYPVTFLIHVSPGQKQFFLQFHFCQSLFPFCHHFWFAAFMSFVFSQNIYLHFCHFVFSSSCTMPLSVFSPVSKPSSWKVTVCLSFFQYNFIISSAFSNTLSWICVYVRLWPSCTVLVPSSGDIVRLLLLALLWYEQPVYQWVKFDVWLSLIPHGVLLGHFQLSFLHHQGIAWCHQ